MNIQKQRDKQNRDSSILIDDQGLGRVHTCGAGLHAEAARAGRRRSSSNPLARSGLRSGFLPVGGSVERTRILREDWAFPN